MEIQEQPEEFCKLQGQQWRRGNPRQLASKTRAASTLRKISNLDMPESNQRLYYPLCQIQIGDASSCFSRGWVWRMGTLCRILFLPKAVAQYKVRVSACVEFVLCPYIWTTMKTAIGCVKEKIEVRLGVHMFKWKKLMSFLNFGVFWLVENYQSTKKYLRS